MKLTDGKNVYEVKMEVYMNDRWVNIERDMLMEEVFSVKIKDRLLIASDIYRVPEEYIENLKAYLKKWEKEYDDWASDKRTEISTIKTYEELKKEWR